MKLIVGDTKSIEYAALKNMEGLKLFKRHECNCECCEFTDAGYCPYCGKLLYDWLSPIIEHKNARAYLGMCPKCNELFLKSWSARSEIKEELKILSNKIENCK
jgi:hypothetical protein